MRYTFLACALLLGAGCKAPKILCTTAHTGVGPGTVPFAVRYELDGPDTGPCAKLKGGLVGVESYVKGGMEQPPSFPKPPVAIRVLEAGQLARAYSKPAADGGAPSDAGPDFPAPAAKAVSSVGEFIDERPDDSGFCKVGPMSPVTLDLPARLGMEARKVTYEWSEVKFYVSARLIGTQFTGKLKYTSDACTANYKVTGIFPGVSCQKLAMCEGMEDPVETGEVDQAACDPCADVAGGRPVGSGISPDVETECVPGVFLCLPKTAPPSLAATPKVCKATSTPAPSGDAAAVAPPPSTFVCPDAAPATPDAGGGGDDTAPAGGDSAAADVAAGG